MSQNANLRRRFSKSANYTAKFRIRLLLRISKNLTSDFNTAERFNARDSQADFSFTLNLFFEISDEATDLLSSPSIHPAGPVLRRSLRNTVRVFWFGLTTLRVKDEWAKYESPSTLLSPHIFYAGTHVSTKSAWTYTNDNRVSDDYVVRACAGVRNASELPSLLILSNNA